LKIRASALWEEIYIKHAKRERERQRVFPSAAAETNPLTRSGHGLSSGRKRFTHSCYNVTIVLYLICGDRTGLTDALQARQSEQTHAYAIGPCIFSLSLSVWRE